MSLLSPDVERLIREAMQRDGYSSADEVVRAGLASLQRPDDGGGFAAGEWDQLLEKAEEGGPALDGEEVLKELRRLRNGTE